MDSTPNPQPILDTLRTVEFRLGLKGYNVAEVDEYLEKAAVEAEAVQEQVRQLTERLRQATDRIVKLEAQLDAGPATMASPAATPAPAAVDVDQMASDETLQRTLVLAQKFVEQTKRESEAEAAEIVRHAHEEARRLSTEAEQRLREEVTRLEGMRTQLSGDVERLARQLESERTRIKATLEELHQWVDEHVQPAATVMASRPRPTAPEGGRAPEGPPAPRTPTPRGDDAPRPERAAATAERGPLFDLNGAGTRERG